MTSLVFDTDVLSTFGKIKRLDLLEKLFPDADSQFQPQSIMNFSRQRIADMSSLIIQQTPGFLKSHYLDKKK